ncbi:threonine aldolase family protein [Ilumatobacter sp.]|uniref:threonine aldolase family protein n=1 Tax=Ilumatobacter sp. TaxID=1967498 RepID=UPI003AF9DC8D
MIFGSDNQAGASERVLAAITEAYRCHDDAYGDDHHTAAANEVLRATFDTDLEAYFVSSGTAANMLALSAMVQPWDGVICHHQAHVLLDESTGPSLFTGGAAMMPVPERDVRLNPQAVESMLGRLPADAPHNVRARALSITQANECGQVYAADEIAALTAVARHANLRVHLDGARFANAVAALDVHPGDLTWRAGVDVMCLGATKNGAVAAEAIVFFDRSLADDFGYRLKRTGHLTSKARLYGAQFVAWLADDHWLDLARHANAAAERLRRELADLPGIRLAWACQSNETFVLVDRPLFESLTAAGVSMYEWYPDALPADERIGDDELLARMVTSWATSDAEVDAFAAAVRAHAH